MQADQILIVAGIVLMGVSLTAGISTVVVYNLLKRHLKEQLKRDYGEPERYNR